MATATLIRTDEELKKEVLAELKWDAQIQPNEIGVSVKDGVVTLTGWVDSYLKKWSAEDAAHKVTGVKAVANDIEIKLATERTDSDIAEAAVHALEWDAGVPSDRVKATVSKGWVTLKGEVEWQYQKQDAEQVVRRLTGVMGVTNLITVKPSAIPRIGVGGHFREMNDLLLLGVDLVPATVSECAVGGSDLFLRRSMHWIGPFWTVGIHKVGAHITVALVHEEALTVGSIGRI